MMEPQDHPDDFAYPGAPPTRPYDTTGWTLAYQMGVTFTRVYSAGDRAVREDHDVDLAAPPAGRSPVRALRPATWSRMSTTTRTR